jgi:hypothetical protein
VSREERMGKRREAGGIALAVRPRYALLRFARSGVHRQPRSPAPEELALMWWLGEQYLATPI